MSSVRDAVRGFVNQTKYFLKAKVPEKILVLVSYATNAVLIALQHFVLKSVGGESAPYVLATDLAVALQLLLPLYVMESIPLIHYVVLFSMLASGIVLDLIDFFSAYYYALSFVISVTLIKMDPVLSHSPVIVKVTTKLSRSLKKARIPRSREELVFNLKLSIVYLAFVFVSLAVFFVTRYAPSLVTVVYNVAVVLFLMLNVAANPMVKVPRGRYSMSLLLVSRYPMLFRLVNRIKMRLHPLIERAGMLIYEVEYISKFVTALFIYSMMLPTLVTTVYIVLPRPLNTVTSALLCVVPVFIYYAPFISVKGRISKRKQVTEKEYPIFLAFATILTSAGVSLYNVFKELSTGKGAELMKGFVSEAKYVVSLVERLGLPENTALERYAVQHPSQEVRSFVLGYLHQLQLGGRVSSYMEQKLSEALDLMKRRMESYVKQIVTLTEIALTVLVLPMLPTVLGFIIAPELVYNMLLMQMLVITPALAFVFNVTANMIKPEFGDKYRFTYITSVIGGIIGMFLSISVVPQKLLAGVAVVVAGIAAGYYVEYSHQRRVYSEIEKLLPQFFRDMSELRNMMSVPDALKKISHMNYPRRFAAILRAASSLRDQGLKLSEQPWHSNSWFWKFTQFIIGKIEEYGGGTPQMFKQLMMFFTEYNNIMSSVKANLKIYEIVVYVIPVIFGTVMYSTIGIFVTMNEFTATLNTDIPSELAANIGVQFPHLTKMMRGVDPVVLTICDIIVVEMSFLLGLLAGKIVSGTFRDTKSLALTMVVATLSLLIIPDFMASFLRGAIAAGR